jgi:thymidylate synthase
MVEEYVTGLTLPMAYHKALNALRKFGEVTDCADWGCQQRELSITMRVSHPLEEPMISRCFIGGAKELQQYVMEMLDGILDFEVEQGKWTYTYHQRMGEQVQFVIDELRRNPSSRRAVISIRTPDDIGSDDPACLQHLQYFIRHDKLDCVVLFRSNDACKATFMNAFALIMLQKRIADALGVEIGQYVHRANSFHCYEKDFTLLDGYVHRIKNQSLSMLTYNYEDDWKELMEDEISDILAQVEELKSHG